MYMNVDIEHAMRILRQFPDNLEREGKPPPDFYIHMILEAAKLVICWNLFEYEDSHFKQLIGTAMSIHTAVLWAITYYY